MLMLGFAFASSTGCEEQTRVEAPGGAALVLEKPNSVTIHRGGTAELEIKVERTALTQPIEVTFDQLPEGVKVINAELQIAGDSAKYVLEAGPEAALVGNHAAKVTAEAGDVTATEALTITVKEKEAQE
jgi:hypothetical protein